MNQNGQNGKHYKWFQELYKCKCEQKKKTKQNTKEMPIRK